MATGRCVNIMRCSKAKNKELIEADKANFICPECGKPLVEVTQQGGTDKADKGEPKKPKKVKGGDKGSNAKLIGIIVAIIAVLGGAGAGIYSVINKEKKPTAIKLDKSTLTMKVGDRDLIVPSVEPEGVKATFTFKTTDNSIIDVTKGGELTARKKGTATITVKCEENPEIRAFCKVTVEDKDTVGPPPPPDSLVEKLSFNEADFTLKEGESKQLSITVSPENHTETLMCSSDDETIATVDESLTVTAKKAGTTNIRITADKSGKNDVVKVTVKPKGDPPYSLGWGNYSGPMSGGKPHGFGGTITVTKSHTIDLKKASGETVQVNRGDKIMNVKMENGKLRQGEIHFSNGTRRYLSGL